MIGFLVLHEKHEQFQWLPHPRLRIAQKEPIS